MAQEEEKFSKRLDDKFSPAAIKKREEFQPFGGHLGTIVFLGVIWLIMNIWAAVYIGKSRNIYFWDASTYWDLSRKIADGSLHCSLSEVYK